MPYLDLSGVMKVPEAPKPLKPVQYFLARRYGKRPNEIAGKDQAWFDTIVRPFKGTTDKFYALDIQPDQKQYLIDVGYDPDVVNGLKSFKAMEAITNHILEYEDDWDFVAAYPYWKSKSKSDGKLYEDAWNRAAARRVTEFNSETVMDEDVEDEVDDDRKLREMLNKLKAAS